MSATFLHALESAFAWMVEASWQASVLAALVLLLQWALRGRLNPRWHHALWLLVVARLILPIQPESALSLFQFAPAPPPAIEQTMTEPIFSTAPMMAEGTVASTPTPPHLQYPFSAFTIVALVWLAVALGLLLLTWFVNLRYARHVLTAPAITEPRLLQLAEAARQEIGLHRGLRMIESTQVQSPAIMGLLRPTLILPKDVRGRFDDEELRFIFLHEFAHLKRGDLVLQWLVALLQILHWFNPMLWYAFRRMRADREPATDALVLSCTGEAQKESYGQVLVKLLEHYHTRHALPTLVGILEDKDQFKRRFSLIARFAGGAYGWSLLGVMLIGILAFGCLTKAKPRETPSAPQLKTAQLEFQISGRPVPLSEGAQKEVISLVENLMAMRYINGSPNEIFRWEMLPGTTVEQIKKSGSFLHLSYAKEKSFPSETSYSSKISEIWIGLEDKTVGDDYPGNPGGFIVVSHDKGGTFNLYLGSRSLLTGIGLNPEIYDHLSATMKQSLDFNRKAYQAYLDWVSAKDEAGDPINPQLVIATQAGDTAKLQKLIAQGADLKAVIPGSGTLLFNAANPEVATLLIEHGLDPNAHDSEGNTALSSICLNGGKGATDTVRVILQHGADPNARTGELKTTPIMGARAGSMVDLLVQYGADIKAVDRDGDNALFWSTWADVSTFEALLRHGIPYDAKTDGPTVLLHATWNHNLPLVNWLLAHGVDPNSPGVWIRNNGHPDMMLPIVAAAISGQPEAATFLLEHGAKGEAAASLALQNHYSDIVKILWDNGVRNISELSYDISQNKKIEDLAKILQNGAPVDPPQDTVVTPLGEAVEMDNLPAVKLLVQYGADVNRGGNPVATHIEHHDTPLVLAAQRGHDEIVTFLLQHGAVANPDAVSGAANAGIPNAFYSEKNHLPSKDHYEQVIQLLIDAGALKNVTPEWAGTILSQAMSPCWGDPDSAVLQKLLAAGLSPEAPMPGLAERGEKPNSVIGYFQDYYQKNKDNLNYGGRVAATKPLLDLLETADKPVRNDPATSATPASAVPDAQLIAAAQTGDTPKSAATGTNPAVMIRIAPKIVQIDEDEYQAHRADIDKAVQKGDVTPLSNLKSYKLLSSPPVLTQSGEQGVLEAVRVIPYSVAFGKDANGNYKPTDFKRQDIGVRFVVFPAFVNGKINFKGDLSITSLDKYTQTEQNPHQPVLHARELPVSELFESGETKGFEVPGGAQMEPADPTFYFPPDKIAEASQNPKALRRIFLFLNTQAFHEDGRPMTAQQIGDDSAKADAAKPIANPLLNSNARDLDMLKSDLLKAMQDADARRVLLDSIKDLPDNQFLATLAGLGRSNPSITALQKEIADKNADIASLLTSGFTEDHPRIVASRAELAVKQQQMKDAIAGVHRAMAIDQQMADSRVTLLQKEVDNAKAQTSPSGR